MRNEICCAGTKWWCAFKSFRFALALIVVLSSAARCQSKNLRQVVPGVWFRTGAPLVLPGGADIRENSVIIEMKDYLVVVDSGTTNSAVGTLADCRAISPKAVKYVFLTHHHFDHVGANAFWTEAGATTMAFAGVAEELRKTPQFQMPQKILDGNKFILEDSTRRVEFHFYGWAHTRGDGIVFLPKDRVLVTGDVVLNAPYNSLFDSDLRNWPDVIRTMEALNPVYVLPGHGQPGSKDLLRGQREFLQSLIAQVESAIQQGKKLEDLVELKDGLPAVSRLTFPPAFATWSDPHLVGPPGAFSFEAIQVKCAWEQLSAPHRTQ